MLLMYTHFADLFNIIQNIHLFVYMFGEQENLDKYTVTKF